MTQPLSIATRCARAGEEHPVVETPPLSPPIYQSAVFKVGDIANLEAINAGEQPGFTYSRSTGGNPTVRSLELTMAQLEGAEAGVAAASGMGIISAVLLATLAPGDHVVAGDVLYGASLLLMREDLARLGVTATFVNIHDLDTVERALRPETKVLYVETISNPLMRVADLPALSEIADRHGVRLVVDSTFTSPSLCQPLAHGADLVLHSGTKFLGGHSDVTCGLLVGSRDLVDAARRHIVNWGMPLSPFEAWLTLRGIKTLALRMERASDNALAIARFLETQPHVLAVHYPGLDAHPDHALAARLFGGRFGPMLSFEVTGGREGVQRLIHNAPAIPYAPSLADVTTTLSHPATSSHRNLTLDERAALGISEGLIRLSVGIEQVDDIIREIQQGLQAIG